MPTAAAYDASEIFPFQLLPKETESADPFPWCDTMTACRIVYAIAHISRSTPYSAVGHCPPWFWPSQAVRNGISDNQNRRCRLAHITPAVTVFAARRRWWWLFQ